MNSFTYHRVLAVFLLSLLLGGSLLSAHAQSVDLFSDLSASHDFGKTILFTGKLEPTTTIKSLDVTFKARSTDKSFVVPASNINGTLSAEYKFNSQDYIPPFGIIEYWFTATLQNGEEIQSSVKTHEYTDNRYSWKNITHQEKYAIYWVDGERSFGQAVLDAVLETNANFSTYLDLPQPETLQIYVYPTNSALQSALEITNARWVAGHANPSNNTILVAIPSSFDQQLSIKRQIPHEVTHLRLYLYLQENYQNLPIWFSEGLASLSEQYTLPEYWQILQAAWRDGQLLEFSDLCTQFPADTGNASLAYAQSDSFTRFIYNKYGKLGLQNLLDAYALGHSCQNGISTALETSLEELNREWREDTFNISILPDSVTAALSWGILLVVLLLMPITLALLPKRK